MIFSIWNNTLQGEEIDLLPSKIVHSPLWHNPFNSIFTFKRDKSKASWTPSAMVKHNLMLNHLPIWGEVLFQFIWKDHISHVLHLKQIVSRPNNLKCLGIKLLWLNIWEYYVTHWSDSFFSQKKNASESQPSVRDGGIPPTKIFFVLGPSFVDISSFGTVLLTSTLINIKHKWEHSPKLSSRLLDVEHRCLTVLPSMTCSSSRTLSITDGSKNWQIQIHEASSYACPSW